MLGQKFIEKIQTAAKRKFIRGYYNPEILINKLSQRLTGEQNRKAIFQAIEEELDDALEFEKTNSIIAFRNTNNELEKYSLINRDNVQTSDININSDVITFFQTHVEPILFSEIDKDAQQPLIDFGFKEKTVLVPFFSPELLEGIIVLSERSNGVVLSENDLAVFRTVQSMVNAVLYRLMPAEVAAQKFAENQKKLYDIERNYARSEKIASQMNLVQEYNHEIRTPLSIIQMRMNNPKFLDTFEESKGIILTQINRAIDIIKLTSRLAHPQLKKESLINVNTAIKNALKVIPLTGIDVKTDLAELPNTMGVLDDLQMVFTNLCINANQAMPSGGTLTIMSRHDHDPDEIHITVADTGIGIPEEDKERVWEPFVSRHQTKDRGIARGLGLSIVFRIIREHLGHISFESKVGSGTTFTIVLPIRVEPNTPIPLP